MNFYRLIIVSAFINLILFFVFIFTRYFHPLLMLTHILTLVIMWLFVLSEKRVRIIFKEKRKEIILIFILVLVAFGIRLYRIDEITPGMYSDEVSVGKMGLALLGKSEIPPWVGTYSYPTPLLYMTAFSTKIFGHTMLALRFPNVIVGALIVGTFYILLRLFFPVSVSLAGATLMMFQYVQMAFSRLAYEIPLSLFFQLLFVIFLVLYYKTKDKLYLAGGALAIGVGLYTYLNFRPFAALVSLLTIFIIYRINRKQFFPQSLMFITTIFIAVMPLLSYAIIDPAGFWGRAQEISIFSRHYSSSEFIKELWGNIYRISTFPFTPDPNPAKNPSGVTIFDPITMILSGVGFAYLFLKKRKLFWIAVFMFVPPFVSDVFSTEVIPEFHYYGLGHPNSARVSGLIGLILFAAVFGVWWIYTTKLERGFRNILLVSLILVISLWNWLIYFNQEQINPSFYLYNYTVNHEDLLSMIGYLNQTPAKKISIPKELIQYEYIPFFLSHEKEAASFEPLSSERISAVIKNSDVTVVNISKDTAPILNKVFEDRGVHELYSLRIISNPANQPVIALFVRN